MTCVFSPCRKYRYTLARLVPVSFRFDNFDPLTLPKFPSEGGTVQFIGLNPSTADELKDDNTIRRLIGFASAWGFTRLVMTNLFAFRATDPEEMKRQKDPIGLETDYWLEETAKEAGLVVACWGNHGAHMERSKAVRAMLPNLHCFRVTGSGEPEHPLYLPKGLEPVPLTTK